MIKLKKDNFFSQQLELQKKASGKTLGTVLMLLVPVLVLSSLYIFNYAEIQRLQKNHTRLEAVINSQKFLQNKMLINDTVRKNEIMEEYHSRVQDVVVQKNLIDVVTNDLLAKISETLPKGVSFQVMSLDAMQLQLMATSDSRVAIAEFQHNLLELGIFNDVHISNISGVPDEANENFSFSLSATLN